MKTQTDSGEVKVRHLIPGRIRVRVSPLRQNEELAQRVVFWLLNSGLASQVDFRPATGSLIILYDAEKTQCEELINLIRQWKEAANKQGSAPALEKTVIRLC